MMHVIFTGRRISAAAASLDLAARLNPVRPGPSLPASLGYPVDSGNYGSWRDRCRQLPGRPRSIARQTPAEVGVAAEGWPAASPRALRRRALGSGAGCRGPALRHMTGNG